MTTPPTFDLHTALAAMADYPALLRRLGAIRVLAVDLTGTGIDPARGGPVTITATPAWTTELPAAQVHVAPVATPAYLGADRFSLYPDGRLDLVAESVEVVEVDTDSAALRLVDLGRQVFHATSTNAASASAEPTLPPPVDPPTELALPSLRNAGLSLVRTDRAADLRRRLVAVAPLLSTTGPAPLGDPEHAVKGYLLDVWDDATATWHTLCARRGTYQLPNEAPFVLDDEGSVSLGATAQAGSGAASPLYLHESLVRWRGWSLVAPRPGQPVTTEATPPAAAGQALPGLSVSFAARPGTLPRLRFGTGYRFQLRLMDVAGHADPLPAAGDFSFATDLVRYLRFEPVVAPMVIPNAPLTEGESVGTLVIRPQPAPSGAVSALLAPLLGTPPLRWLAPPKVAELVCEEHGRFDDAGGAPDPALYAAIAQRDAVDLSTIGTPDPNRPDQRYVAGSSLPVTWLPDPICRGAALAGDGNVLQHSFTPLPPQSWPDLKPWRVQLDDGDSGQFWNPGLRILTFFVPRGRTLTLALTSFVDPGDLALLGQLDWLASGGASAAEIAAARADVLAGQARQITPPRNLTLVNAVRVPVSAPTLPGVVPDPARPRTPGSTKQDLVVTAEVDRPSTGKLTLRADWTDPVDDVSAPEPATMTSTATPAELSVAYDPDPVTGAAVVFPATQVFGDPRRHQVTYSAVATTRYMEYFVQRGAVTFSGTSPLALSSAGIVDGTDTVRSLPGSAPAVTYRRGIDYTVDYQAGNMARLAAGAIPDGAPVEVAIVAPPVSRPSPAPGVTLDLPSTVRPAAPQVAWIVPTFGWATGYADLGLTVSRTRRGGGLRVFLERPWYSSGTGEQLAVVVGPVDATDLELASLVTQLGADPAVVTQTPAPFPAAADFTAAVSRPSGLSLAELAGRSSPPTVSAAAHEVGWDADRRRWACDIVVSPGAVYAPFARLVLARYQPNSVSPDVALSPVALAQWAQLAPDRSVTVTSDLLDLTKVSVSVVGRSGGGTQARPGEPNVVSVTVQSAPLDGGGDFGWVTVGPAGGQVLAGATQPDGTTLWSGVIGLPTSRVSAQYRLVLTEQEQYAGGGRVVYSDVVGIPASRI